MKATRDLPESDLVTIAEAARWLRVSTMTIHRMIERKDLRATKLGGVWRIRRTDLEGLIK